MQVLCAVFPVSRLELTIKPSLDELVSNGPEAVRT